MKPSTHAPFFACLYASLCDTARKHGYALAIHGTVTADCDVIAVPWTDDASEAETLMQALMSQIGALDYRGLLRRDCGRWADDAQIDEMVKAERERNGDPRGPFDCALKPHGRRAWNLYMEHGCKVDLSVMPRITTDSRESQNESSADTAGVAPRHATDGIPPLSAALCYPLAESTQNTLP